MHTTRPVSYTHLDVYKRQDEQLAPLRKGEITSAYFEPEIKTKTGLSHQYGKEVGSMGDSKKDEANAALRALFGHEED